MIAIPVKSNSVESAVAPTFGKVKYFAVIDDKNSSVSFIENIEKSGVKAVELLLSHNVNVLLMSHIGERPFSLITSQGVDVYFVGNERITIDEAVLKYRNGQLQNAKDIDLNLFSKHHKPSPFMHSFLHI